MYLAVARKWQFFGATIYPAKVRIPWVDNDNDCGDDDKMMITMMMMMMIMMMIMM